MPQIIFVFLTLKIKCSSIAVFTSTENQLIFLGINILLPLDVSELLVAFFGFPSLFCAFSACLVQPITKEVCICIFREIVLPITVISYIRLVKSCVH